MQPQSTWVERLLLGASFLALLLIGLSSMGRHWLEPWLPAVYADRFPPLTGVVSAPTHAAFSLAGAWNGDLQRGAEEWAAQDAVQRNMLVRTFNEVAFRTFRTSYMNNRTLVIGDRNTLFEKLYVDAYCGLRVATDRAAPAPFANRLRAAQLWFRGRGQRLVYTIAPAKTSWFPDRIGHAFPCTAEQRDKNYPRNLAALREAGVDFVDGRAVLEAARPRAGDMFPRNGTHWNQLGSALFVQAVVTHLRETGLTAVPEFRFTVSQDPVESGAENDLINLANLLYPPSGAASPAIGLVPPDSAPQLRMASVNDSFFYGPAWYLSAGGIFQNVDFFYYFSIFRREYPALDNIAVNPANRADFAAILRADVVLLEEVEERSGGPLASQFLDFVEQQMLLGN